MNRIDPESKEFVRQRYQNACELFEREEMTPDVFRATLYQLGYRGREIESEVALHEPER